MTHDTVDQPVPVAAIDLATGERAWETDLGLIEAPTIHAGAGVRDVLFAHVSGTAGRDLRTIRHV
ncbi:MAG: hypothetical protein LBJ62_02825 [Bifidobacteriaceae bacterium]|nr:hypothetical protein [Bifidobacteriaceae bacterium]